MLPNKSDVASDNSSDTEPPQSHVGRLKTTFLRAKHWLDDVPYCGPNIGWMIDVPYAARLGQAAPSRFIYTHNKLRCVQTFVSLYDSINSPSRRISMLFLRRVHVRCSQLPQQPTLCNKKEETTTSGSQQISFSAWSLLLNV